MKSLGQSSIIVETFNLAMQPHIVDRSIMTICHSFSSSLRSVHIYDPACEIKSS